VEKAKIKEIPDDPATQQNWPAGLVDPALPINLCVDQSIGG
jgi:hypothetical protein